MNITIRRYANGDKQNLTESIAQLQDFIAALDPLHRIRTKKHFNADAYVKRIFDSIHKNNGVILIAEDAHVFIGYVIGIIRLPDESNLEGYPSVDGIIEELYITPEYRRKNVGIMLMEAIETYLWQNACSTIKVNCFAPNSNAHQFYAKLGYTDRQITLIKSYS
jgi:GNAT superfamily N-acetyltransferase